MLLPLDGLTEGRVPQFRHIARLGPGHTDAAVRPENIERKFTWLYLCEGTQWLPTDMFAVLLYLKCIFSVTSFIWFNFLPCVMPILIYLSVDICLSGNIVFVI